jgi:transcriptional antiterminator NusG
MARQWYILHTYSGYENKVKQALERLQAVELGEVLGEVKVPVENVVEIRSGRKRELKKKFFPGYILVQMDLPDDEHSWKEIASRIRTINGVTGFLGSTRNKRPSPVTDDDMRNVLAKMGEIKTEAGVRISHRISFAIGEHVKVIDGPFKNFKGTIENINQEKESIRVKVEIFGRATPVELSYTQVEKD